MRPALRLCLCLLPLCLFTPSAGAGDGTDSAGWNGSVDAGYTALAGNSDASTVLGAAQGKRTTGRWTHHLEARGRNTEENNTRTAEAYRLAGKEDIALDARNYLFFTAGWDKDRFSGYEWQLAAAAGYGRKLIDAPHQHLSVEAGPGYRHDELPGNDTEDSSLFYAAADYDRAVGDNARFTQKLAAEIGDDDTTTRALSTLAVQINARLALKASLEIRRHSDPPAGTKNSDRTTTIGLSWNF